MTIQILLALFWGSPLASIKNKNGGGEPWKVTTQLCDHVISWLEQLQYYYWKSELQHSLVRPQHDSNSSDSREVSSFLDFSPQVLLISVPARTRVQFEGGVNITQQCIPSKVLAHVRSVRREVLVAASNERNCLSRDLCCSVSCHPSRLYSTRPSSVPWCEWLLHLEPHPPHVNFIIVRALVEGGFNFA